jgi:hypothetical protein
VVPNVQKKISAFDLVAADIGRSGLYCDFSGQVEPMMD